MKKAIFTLLCLLPAFTCYAAVITVDNDGPADFNNIQAAIDDSNDGDIIIVADGMYMGLGNRRISFWGKAITLKSENGPQNCIIDCGYPGRNWYNAFSFINGEGSASVLEGFTITGCYDPQGAIYCRSSSPVIKNCVFVDNIGWRGAAIKCSHQANPELINCTIIHNWSEAVFGEGGAVYCNDSNLVLVNCTLTNNFSEKTGGGIYCEDGTVTLTNCIVWGNEPDEIYLDSSSLSATYSCIQGGWPGVTNIDEDPLLTQDGHLQMDSPCINAGDPNYSPALAETDIDGEMRVIADRIDMGCDEFLDTDSDGLPDWWEMKFSGLDTEVDPNGDPDGDGKSNLEEYILSTNPLGAYYVDNTKGSDAWDGFAVFWDGLHGPKKTIQAGINATFDGDKIIVLDGIYTGDGNRDIDYRGRAITLKSQNGPKKCIIDCQAGSENVHRGLYFHWGEDANSILEGVMITNGVAFNGGGIYCEDSSPTITKCIIVNNYSRWRDGGGIFCDHSSPRIMGCLISDNRADDDGGGVFCDGHSNVTVSNCMIIGNKASRDGGGLEFWYYSKPNVTNCVIAGNEAGRHGGGIDCFIDSPPTLTNCTIVGNEGGGLHDCYGPITNCIIWNNSPHDLSGSSVPTYSCYSGASIGMGNIDVDPCFVLPGYWADANDPNIIVEPNDPNAAWIEGDYYLYPLSLCINAGDLNYLPEPNETDLDGSPRVIAGRVDMGAYESNHIDARLWILPRTINRHSRQRRIMAWLRLPQGVAKDDIDSNTPLLLYPGEIEPTRQYIFPRGRRPKRVSIIAYFDKRDLMDVISNNGRVELKLVGRLKTGRYFYGTDTVRIINRRPPPRRPRRRR